VRLQAHPGNCTNDVLSPSTSLSGPLCFYRDILNPKKMNILAREGKEVKLSEMGQNADEFSSMFSSQLAIC
jgi:hypothetical protein